MSSAVAPRNIGAVPDVEPVGTLAVVTEEADELVVRCQEGDTAAFRELFRRHRKDVARLVQRMLGRSNDLEDVIQEVFLQVHRSLKDFQSRSRFSTWLYRVTVNVVLMQRRAARSRPQYVDTVDHRPLADERPAPDEDAARRARVLAFYRLLERLSEKKRTVFVLHELEGMPPAEIAEVVGAPVLTVRTRLFYARRELAEAFDEEPCLAGLAEEVGMSEPRATGRAAKVQARAKEKRS